MGVDLKAPDEIRRHFKAIIIIIIIIIIKKGW